MLRLTLVLLLVWLPATVAETCDACETAYDPLTGDDAAKCTAAGVYGKCLFTATGDGCDTLTTEVGTLKTNISALTTPPCSLTDTCTCQLDYLATDVSTTTAKCAAVTTLYTCTTSLTTDGCGDETNADVKTTIAALVTECSGASVVQLSVLSVLAIIVGVFYRN